MRYGGLSPWAAREKRIESLRSLQSLDDDALNARWSVVRHRLKAVRNGYAALLAPITHAATRDYVGRSLKSLEGWQARIDSGVMASVMAIADVRPWMQLAVAETSIAGAERNLATLHAWVDKSGPHFQMFEDDTWDVLWTVGDGDDQIVCDAISLPGKRWGIRLLKRGTLLYERTFENVREAGDWEDAEHARLEKGDGIAGVVELPSSDG